MRLMRKLVKDPGRTPRVMITDKLRSYGAAKQEIMPGVEYRSHKGLNNRAENSHPLVRLVRVDHEAIQVKAASATLRFHP